MFCLMLNNANILNMREKYNEYEKYIILVT